MRWIAADSSTARREGCAAAGETLMTAMIFRTGSSQYQPYRHDIEWLHQGKIRNDRLRRQRLARRRAAGLQRIVAAEEADVDDGV